MRTAGWLRQLRRTMIRLAGWDKTHFLELDLFGRLLRQAQVAEVYRIERAAENADRL
jgi:hypothetical protein